MFDNNKFSQFVNYAMENGADSTIELECRFGSYNKIYSTVKPDTFFYVYSLFKNRKKTTHYICDTIYEDKRKRSVGNDTYVKKMFNKPDIIKNIKTYVKSLEKSLKKDIILKKEKIFKPISGEKIKIDIVKEIEEPDITIKNPNYKKK